MTLGIAIGPCACVWCIDYTPPDTSYALRNMTGFFQAHDSLGTHPCLRIHTVCPCSTSSQPSRLAQTRTFTCGTLPVPYPSYEYTDIFRPSTRLLRFLRRRHHAGGPEGRRVERGFLRRSRACDYPTRHFFLLVLVPPHEDKEGGRLTGRWPPKRTGFRPARHPSPGRPRACWPEARWKG